MSNNKQKWEAVKGKHLCTGCDCVLNGQRNECNNPLRREAERATGKDCNLHGIIFKLSDSIDEMEDNKRDLCL